MQVNQVVDFYSKQSETYESIKGYSYWEILYHEYKEWIRKHLYKQNLRIAELGCGTGLTSDPLLEKDNTVFGIDITRQLLEFAKKRHCKQKFLAIESDITNLPFADKSVDGVVSLDTLEHIDSIEKAISEISRICKPGATFLFDIPSSLIFDFSYFLGFYGKSGFISALKSLTHNKVMFEWESLDDDFKPERIKTYRYRPTYFEKILKSYGFSILEKRGVHISTMLIPERIQANTASPMISKINNMLRKVDEVLNKNSSIRNHALYILYACKLGS